MDKMSSDEQEARSRKYSNDVFIFLRLKSGKIAIFDNTRDLIDIIEPNHCLDEILPDTVFTDNPKDVKALRRSIL
jgi:hypothetical protein